MSQKPIEELVKDMEEGDIVRLLWDIGEFIGYYRGSKPFPGKNCTVYTFYNVAGERGVCGDSVFLKENVLYLDGGRFPKNWFKISEYEILGRQNTYPEK